MKNIEVSAAIIVFDDKRNLGRLAEYAKKI